ncbi:MAG: 16S rRNA pseudouridine(516) synthase, partial [Methylophilaceae bacterium]
KRIKIGEVTLPNDLAEGAWRWLTLEELHLLTHTEKI